MLTASEVIVHKNANRREKREKSKGNTNIDDQCIRKEKSNKSFKQQNDSPAKDDTSKSIHKEDNATDDVGVNKISSKENINTGQVDKLAQSSKNSLTNLKNNCLKQARRREEICNSSCVPTEKQNSSRQHSFLYVVNVSDDDISTSEKNNRNSSKMSQIMNGINISINVDDKFKVKDVTVQNRRTEGNNITHTTSSNKQIVFDTDEEDLKNNDNSNKPVHEFSKKSSNIKNETPNEKLSKKKIRMSRKKLNSTTGLSVKKDVTTGKRQEINSTTTICLVPRDQNVENKLNIERNEKMAGTVSREIIDACHKEIENQLKPQRLTVSKIRKHSEKMKMQHHDNDITQESHESESTDVESSIDKINEKKIKFINIPIKCQTEVPGHNSEETDQIIKSKFEEIPLEIVQNQNITNKQVRTQSNSPRGKRCDVRNVSNIGKVKCKTAATNTTKLHEPRNNKQNTSLTSGVLKRPTSETVSITKVTITNRADKDRCSNPISSESYVIISQNKSDKKSDSKIQDSKLDIPKGKYKSMQNLLEHESRSKQIPLQPTTQSVSYFRTKSKSPLKIQINQNSRPKYISGDEVISKMLSSTKKEANVTPEKSNASSDVVIQPTVQTTASKLRLREKSRKVAEKLSITRRHIINENWATDIKPSNNYCNIQRWIERNQNGFSDGWGNAVPGNEKSSEGFLNKNASRRKIEPPKNKLFNGADKRRQNITIKPVEKYGKDKTFLKKGEVTLKTSISKNVSGTNRSGVNLRGFKQKYSSFSRKGTTSNLMRTISQTSSRSSNINKKRSTSRSQASSNKSSSSKVLQSDTSARGKHKALTESMRPVSAKKSIGGMVDDLKLIEAPCKVEKNYIQLNIMRASERKSKSSTSSQKQSNLGNKNKGVLPRNIPLDPPDNYYSKKKDVNSVQNSQINQAKNSENSAGKTSFNYPNDIIFNVPTSSNPEGPSSSNVTYTAHKLISSVQETTNNAKKQTVSCFSRTTDHPKSANRFISEKGDNLTKPEQRVRRQVNTCASARPVHINSDKYRSDARNKRDTKTNNIEDENANNTVNNEMNTTVSKITKTNDKTTPCTERRDVSRPGLRQKSADGHSKMISVLKREFVTNRHEPYSRISSAKAVLECGVSDKINDNIETSDLSRSNAVLGNSNTGNLAAEGTSASKKMNNLKNVDNVGVKKKEANPRPSSLKRKPRNVVPQTEIDRSKDAESAYSAGKIKNKDKERSLTPNRKAITKSDIAAFNSSTTANPEFKAKVPASKSTLHPRARDVSTIRDNKNNDIIVNIATSDTHDTNDKPKGTKEGEQETNIRLRKIRSMSGRGRRVCVRKEGDSENSARHSSISSRLDGITIGDGNEKAGISQPLGISVVTKAVDNSNADNIPSKRNDSGKGSSQRKVVTSNTKDEQNILKPIVTKGLHHSKSTVSRPKTYNVTQKSADKSPVNDTDSSNNQNQKTVEMHTIESAETVDTDKVKTEEIDENKDNTNKFISRKTTRQLYSTLQDSEGKRSLSKETQETLRKKTISQKCLATHSQKTLYSSRTCVDITGKRASSGSKIQKNCNSAEPRKIHSDFKRLKESYTHPCINRNMDSAVSNTREEDQNIINALLQREEAATNNELKIQENVGFDISLDSNYNNEVGTANTNETVDKDVIYPVTEASSIYIIDATDFNKGRVHTQANLICLNIREVSSDIDLSKAVETLNGPRGHPLFLSTSREKFRTISSEMTGNEDATPRSDVRMDNTLVVGDISQGIAVIIRPKSKPFLRSEGTDVTISDDLTYDGVNSTILASGKGNDRIDTTPPETNVQRINIKSGSAKRRKVRDSSHELNMHDFSIMFVKSPAKVEDEGTINATVDTESFDMNQLPKSIETTPVPSRNIGTENETESKKIELDAVEMNTCTEYKVQECKTSSENVGNANLIPYHIPEDDNYSDVTFRKDKASTSFPQPLVHSVTLLIRENNNNSKIPKEETGILQYSDSNESTNFSEEEEEENDYFAASDSGKCQVFDDLL